MRSAANPVVPPMEFGSAPRPIRVQLMPVFEHWIALESPVVDGNADHSHSRASREWSGNFLHGGLQRMCLKNPTKKVLRGKAKRTIAARRKEAKRALPKRTEFTSRPNHHPWPARQQLQWPQPLLLRDEAFLDYQITDLPITAIEPMSGLTGTFTEAKGLRHSNFCRPAPQTKFCYWFDL